jgi:two-component system response regulator MtrA
MPSVLVVEDDQDLAEMLGIVLNGAGIEVDLVSRGDEALEVFRNNQPDVVLLDVMLPGFDGVEVCKAIRQESPRVPIIFLSARGETPDKIKGLDAGADDYLVKPMEHYSELVARIKTQLRRNSRDLTGHLTLGDLTIDLVEHSVTRAGRAIPLTRLEFDLLVALAKEPGRVFTREELLREVWDYRHSADTRLVNVHVQRLRSKIEHDPDQPSLVLTVRGVGYKSGANGNR